MVLITSFNYSKHVPGESRKSTDAVKDKFMADLCFNSVISTLFINMHIQSMRQQIEQLYSAAETKEMCKNDVKTKSQMSTVEFNFKSRRS